MPHEVTTTDSGDILVSAGDAALITITDRFSALYEVVNVDTFIVSASAVYTDRLFVVSANFTEAFILNDMRVRVTAAIPTAGTHARGDIAYNSTPAAGGTVGWVNVVAGTPGTWKEFGVIEA